MAAGPHVRAHRHVGTQQGAFASGGTYVRCVQMMMCSPHRTTLPSHHLAVTSHHLTVTAQDATRAGSELRRGLGVALLLDPAPPNPKPQTMPSNLRQMT